MHTSARDSPMLSAGHMQATEFVEAGERAWWNFWVCSGRRGLDRI